MLSIHSLALFSCQHPTFLICLFMTMCSFLLFHRIGLRYGIPFFASVPFLARYRCAVSVSLCHASSFPSFLPTQKRSTSHFPAHQKGLFSQTVDTPFICGMLSGSPGFSLFERSQHWQQTARGGGNDTTLNFSRSALNIKISSQSFSSCNRCRTGPSSRHL